ncbi:MAG: hypothetical protein P1V81_02285 [Planctomycetota bacterium]|nr:hypothetical protein [Planctomycetota bacterium]
MITKLLTAPALAALLFVAMPAGARAEVRGISPFKPKVVQPKPTLGGCSIHTHCIQKTVFVPGHYQAVEKQVWIAPKQVKVWVEPIFETRYDYCGQPYTVLIQAGHWAKHHQPGHFETVLEQVFQPGHYEIQCARVPAPKKGFGGYGGGHGKQQVKPFG